MRHFLYAWLLSLLAGPAWAQAPRWERLIDFPGTGADQFGYMRPLPGGDYLVYGAGSTGRGYPALTARYRPDGTLVYQRLGRTLWTGEQDMHLLPSGNLLLAASVSRNLFFQRQRANGDTLPGLRYPTSRFEGFPAQMRADGDSVRLLLTAIDGTPGFSHFALATADTAGQLGPIRHYPNPVPNNAYACDLVPTPRRGWLLAGQVAVVEAGNAGFHPYLVETDAQGKLRRQRVLTLFAATDNEAVYRLWHNIIRLRDGSGYVFSGWQQVGGSSANPTWGFLCKLDTALNVVWTYRHPPQARRNLLPTQVRELADGTLGWLAGDGPVNGQTLTPYLYMLRLSAQGQLLGQRTFTSQACTGLRLCSWQPTADERGAVVTGGYSTCTATGTALVAYTARLDEALVLATTPGGAGTSTGAARLWPNPASGEVSWQGAVPAGATQAELLVVDALGRAVRRVALAGRGAQVTQAVPLAGLAPGAYAVRLLVEGAAAGPPARLLVEP